jgi:hypothetical protein
VSGSINDSFSDRTRSKKTVVSNIMSSVATVISSMLSGLSSQYSGGSNEEVTQRVHQNFETQQHQNFLLGEENAELQRLLEDVNQRLVACQVDHIVVPGQYLMPMDPQHFGAVVGAELDRIDLQLQQAFGQTLHQVMHAQN